MTYIQITDSQMLAAFCQTPATILAVDTEFVRTRTFYAKPGLYQLHDGHQTALIDPLAVTDLSPLWRLLHDPARLCLLHAGGEDLELFQHQSGAQPARVHDTQLAASFLGLGTQLGFAALVEQILGVSLDKAHARTDWLARPLSADQLRYAADDVIYLYPLYQQLWQRLELRGLTGWFEQECEWAVKRRGISTEPELAYLDVKNAWLLKPQALGILQRLCQWRLAEARRRDLALNFVVKEAHLFEVANGAPRSLSDLNRLGLEPMEIKRHGDTLLALVQEALASPDSWPEPVRRLVDYPGYKAELKRIRTIVEQAGADAGLPAELIASKRLIHQYLSWKWRLEESEQLTPALLQGWRGELLKDRL
ncbi:ribonuclease D [Zobellella endophytica]|uniref:Ribonuclease D n=1 Tax=Zobellella endophytica TaxID=2116700 RepID=A0A2P7RCE7_9GAMM|nr:ribonuclease D [Zobellella endophytica]PSJ47907.1 ribonuclease D [Zobellella endophytica]